MEHPRASTSDDVECFFSVLRDVVGKDFTHKKVCLPSEAPDIGNIPARLCYYCFNVIIYLRI